jgi:hypothetical protein
MAVAGMTTLVPGTGVSCEIDLAQSNGPGWPRAGSNHRGGPAGKPDLNTLSHQSLAATTAAPTVHVVGNRTSLSEKLHGPPG